MNWFMDGNEGLLMNLTKGESMLMFDEILNIKGGFVYGIKMAPVLNQVANTVVETKKTMKVMSVDIKKLHKILGHCGETPQR
jgi:hypothetical protein